MALSALQATILATFNFAITKTTDALSAGQSNINNTHNGNLTAVGTTAAKGDQIVSIAGRTLAASTGESLNISGGASSGAVALTNPLGEAVSLTKIKALFIKNTGATILKIFTKGADDFTSMLAANGDGILLRPGAVFFIFCGVADADAYAVATDEVLLVTNTDGAVSGSYDVQIAGIE